MNQKDESIHHISGQIQAKKVSSAELVEKSLKRIEELNAKLNAFITVLPEDARARAKEADSEIASGKLIGPLHGIPIAFKDFYDTAGVKTTAAFKHFAKRIPKKDALSVSKLRAAGAVIVGKTNMHELGMGTTSLASHYGPVHNPINPDYIAGGSSGGSAVAVATEMVFATVDTDAIGSCRLPASCCGVVGFKGTYGLISGEGILAGEKTDEFILWLAHVGITTRSVADVALLLDVLAEKKPEAGFLSLSGDAKFRIGIANNFQADPYIDAHFKKSVEIIRKLGHSMEEVPAPFFDLSNGIKNIESDRKGVAERSFNNMDLIILPTTAARVPTIKDAKKNPQALSPQNTAFANYYGLPAISVPCGKDSNGLPVGLQIVGKPWDDAAVLQLGWQFEKQFGGLS